MKTIVIDGIEYNLVPTPKSVRVKETNSNPKKGTLGCKNNCCDYPDCHPTCRVRWYHK